MDGRSGIGYQIAEDLLQLSVKVVSCSRKEELLQATQKELSAFGTVAAMACDSR